MLLRFFEIFIACVFCLIRAIYSLEHIPTLASLLYELLNIMVTFKSFMCKQQTSRLTKQQNKNAEVLISKKLELAAISSLHQVIVTSFDFR